MWRKYLLTAGAVSLLCLQPMMAQTSVASTYNAQLAKAMGGNDNGMRSYVLVVLKTGPTKVPRRASPDQNV